MRQNIKLGYSLREASQLVPFSIPTLYRFMAEGKLRYTKVGGRRVITHSALREFVGEVSE